MARRLHLVKPGTEYILDTRPPLVRELEALTGSLRYGQVDAEEFALRLDPWQSHAERIADRLELQVARLDPAHPTVPFYRILIDVHLTLAEALSDAAEAADMTDLPLVQEAMEQALQAVGMLAETGNSLRPWAA